MPGSKEYWRVLESTGEYCRVLVPGNEEYCRVLESTREYWIV